MPHWNLDTVRLTDCLGNEIGVDHAMGKGKMKVLCCGDRNWTNRKVIQVVLASIGNRVEAIIEGEARGADRIARQEAEALGLKVLPFPADWDRYGRSAGFKRNIEMLNQEPGLVIAFHDSLETSKGTSHIIREAKARGIQVIVVSSNGKMVKC